jgi:hypothetical protein
MCTRAVSALAHYFEQEGLATVAIVLIREHAERIKPPRALWVPFELGRPLGAPGDAAFQHEVIRAALALLDSPFGPVLADFPKEAPADLEMQPSEGWACPVDFTNEPPSLAPVLAEQVKAEIASLAPWREKAVARRGRSMLGISGMTVEEIVDFLLHLVDGTPHNEKNSEALCLRFKAATDDLTGYYMEAAWARPGIPKRDQILNWLWGETALGKFLLTVCKHAAQSNDKMIVAFARNMIVPVEQRHRFKSL